MINPLEDEVLDVDAALAENALAIMQRLAPPPRGKRRGAEYLLLNPRRRDKHLGSFRINLGTTLWADFAVPDVKGYGLVSLLEYVFDADATTAMRWGLAALGQIPPIKDAPECLAEPLSPDELASTAEVQRKLQTTSTQIQWTPQPITAAEERTLRRAYPTLFALRRPDHIYRYRDTAGDVRLLELRWDARGGRDKVIRPALLGVPAIHAGIEGEDIPPRWVPAWPPKCPLLNSDRIAAAPPSAVILLVEGPKAAVGAERYINSDTIPTCIAGGHVERAELDVLRGRKVVIWPDADEAGLRFASRVEERLLSIGSAAVGMARLPGRISA